MKVRNGFVSNSSSSSFIIAFPKVPKTAKEIQKWMFDGIEYLSHPYQREAVSTKKAADSVFTKMEKLDESKIAEELRPPYEMYKKHFDSVSYQDKEAYEKANKAYTKEATAYCKNEAKAFLKENEGKVFYIVEYEDHDSFGSFMEHGPAFDDIPHIRVSKH